jgi:hypothetical protein
MDKLIPLFPKINKINYDIVSNLKNSTCLFIPKGPKLFAWFTYYNNKSICLFYNQDHEKIFTKYVSFKEELSLGTILYGTLIDNHFLQFIFKENLLNILVEMKYELFLYSS